MKTIIILDFGSQYTQLIARTVREANVYCEIQPYNKPITAANVVGVILSGSPCSVNDVDAPSVNVNAIALLYPILAICYGAQLVAKQLGGTVNKSNKREYGRASLEVCSEASLLLKDVETTSQVWMSHSDSITHLPEGYTTIATTDSIPIAAFENSKGVGNRIFGVQFHPEVYHSAEGKKIINNYLKNVCKCTGSFTPNQFVTQTISQLQQQVGTQKVIMAISGGVDSTVAATLIHRAIGANLYCIFVDNGLLRKNEYEQVLETYKEIGLNIKGVKAADLFISF